MTVLQYIHVNGPLPLHSELSAVCSALSYDYLTGVSVWQ